MTPEQQTKLKNNVTYWQKRYSNIEQAAHDKSVVCFNELSEKYRKAEAEINKEINAWYQRFAVNNKISMTEARRLLNSNELEELRWNVEQYIKAGWENAIDKRWMKELENASAKFHINRLEALKLNAQQSIEKMLGGASDNVDSMLRDVYRTSFYRSCFELQKGRGIGFDVSQINENYLDKILSKPWCVDGSNFSDRIWKEKTKLVNTLDNELTRLAITGEDPKTAIDNISKAMNVSKTNASRIIMTEQAYFTSRAQADSFKELDVGMFEVCSALDSLTCSLCAELDGTHYAMTDFKPGLTAPPFHPNCRCVTVPCFDDEFDNTGERAARGKDDKTYYVPADMTYKDWKKSFVDGDKTGLQETSTNGIIKRKKQVAEKLKTENFPSSFTEKSELKNTQTFIDYVNQLKGADANVVALFNRMGKLESIESNGIPFTISHAKDHAVSVSSYKMTGNIAEAKLTIPKLQGENLAGQVNTILHEEMHLIDLYGRQDLQKPGNWFSTSRKPLIDVFRNTPDTMSDDIIKLFDKHDIEVKRIEDEVNAKYNKMISELNDSVMNRTFKGNYNREYKKIKEAAKKEIDYECRNIMGGGIGNLQDIYDALSGGKFRNTKKVVYGHGSSYYTNIESRIHETIANYAALSVTRPDLIDLLRLNKPELVAELDTTIAELLKKVGAE